METNQNFFKKSFDFICLSLFLSFVYLLTKQYWKREKPATFIYCGFQACLFLYIKTHSSDLINPICTVQYLASLLWAYKIVKIVKTGAQIKKMPNSFVHLKLYAVCKQNAVSQRSLWPDVFVVSFFLFNKTGSTVNNLEFSKCTFDHFKQCDKNFCTK